MTATDREVRAILRAQHGSPARHNTDEALRALGLRDQIHPIDAVAFRYSSKEAAEDYERANLEEYGHPSHNYECPEQGFWVGLVDLRPALIALGQTPADPKQP